MSRRRKRRESRSAGNIKAEGVYDPFPKSGLVKQYERFIRKHVREFCAGYPGLQYELALGWAIERAIAAEAKFKPELGNDFSTFLRPYLRRLHRLAQRETNDCRKSTKPRRREIVVKPRRRESDRMSQRLRAAVTEQE